MTTDPTPHPDDLAVDRFAARMKWKPGQARARGRRGWQDKSWTPEQISQALREHVEKGDPMDVANYCMFLAARNEPIEKTTHALPSEKPPTCEWEKDEDDTWNTQCGNAFAFSDGGPKGNDFAHCCYCGANLIQAADRIEGTE